MGSDAFFGLTLPELKENIALMGFEEKLATGAINTDYWTETTADSGAWSIGYNSFDFTTGATANSIARLVGKQIFPTHSTLVDENELFNKFVVEFALSMSGFADVDESKFFIGLGRSDATTRASQNIMGLKIDTGVWRFFTDRGGTEVQGNSLGAPTSAFTHFRVEMQGKNFKIYKDREYFETITAGSNMTLSNFLINVENANAAAVTGGIAGLRMWLE